MRKEGKIFKKFQSLLSDLFPFDSSDLDFGISRILNHKRKETEDFIQNKIPIIVEETYEKHKSTITENHGKHRQRV